MVFNAEEVFNRVEHVERVEDFSTQRRRDAEYAEKNLNRVEHVERVEGGGKPQSTQRTQRWILEMGFHPIPRMRANRN